VSTYKVSLEQLGPVLESYLARVIPLGQLEL